jgi:hypothetical protein
MDGRIDGMGWDGMERRTDRKTNRYLSRNSDRNHWRVFVVLRSVRVVNGFSMVVDR